jgi:hypothetical protein
MLVCFKWHFENLRSSTVGAAVVHAFSVVTAAVIVHWKLDFLTSTFTDVMRASRKAHTSP